MLGIKISQMQVNILSGVFRDKLGEEIVVRPLLPADRDKLIEMYRTLSPENRCLGLPPQSREALENWIEYLVSNGFSLIAECGNRIVGHVAVLPSNGNADLTIFVHQDYQNRGIGQFMLEQVIRFCRSAGFKGVTLVTEKRNVRAIHVYRKLGFRFVSSVCDCDMYLPLR